MISMYPSQLETNYEELSHFHMKTLREIVKIMIVESNKVFFA